MRKSKQYNIETNLNSDVECDEINDVDDKSDNDDDDENEECDVNDINEHNYGEQKMPTSVAVYLPYQEST